MKNYHIKDLLKKNLLLVELPDEREIIPHDNGIIVIKDSVVQWEIKGSYTLLGKPDEIREEDARELVQKIEYDFGTCYRHYTDKTVSAKTAKESLLSLLESEIYWKNPYKIYDLSTWHDVSKEYDAAELRTFDRSRSIILVKQ